MKNLQEIIIPRYALQEIIKALPLFGSMNCTSLFDEMSLQFVGENIIFKTRLIEGKFPNCDPNHSQKNLIAKFNLKHARKS